MLTGQRAFEGDTDSAILARVIEREPDWSRLPADLPPRIRILLQRCLEKDPKKRQRDSGDVRLDVEQALVELATPATRASADRTRRSWLVASIVAAIVAVIAIVPLVRRDLPVAETRPQEFVLLPPPGMAFGANVVDRVPPFAVSPDGQRLAFVATETSSGRGSIWLRSLDDLDAVRLNGTEGGTTPFWSPDSRFVAFFADGRLKKAAVAGGSAVTLAEVAGSGSGGTWNRDGVIVFAPGPQSALLRVSDTGGTPSPVTQLGSAGDLGHVRPQFLPDGRHFLFFAVAAAPRRGIYVGDLESAEVRPVLATREMARYAPSGHLLFLQEGRLVAQDFDASQFALSGDPTPIAESVAFVSPDGRAAFDVSETGTLVYRVSGIQAATQPHWIDRSGNTIGAVGEPGDYQTASLSPDGSRLAVEMHDLRSGTGDLWIIDLVRRSPSRLTFDGMHHNTAVWSPDGSEIVFSGRPNGGRNLHRKTVSEGQSEEALLAPGPERVPSDWSHDGHYILYEEGPAGQRDLWALQMPERKAVLLLRSDFNETGGHLSEDGRWVAYVSNETGRAEVYVRSFPAMTDQRKISGNGGIAPRWSRDGTELFFVGLDNTVYSVPVAAGARFESGTPRLLFATDMRSSPVVGSERTPGSTADAWFAVDQQRFLIVPTPTGPSPPAPPLTVVRDWASALTRPAR